MRIAFDLDDTLIPTTQSFVVGSEKMKWPYRLIYKEELRIGAVQLLVDLQIEHDIWIYTTSLRSAFYVKSWFKLLGINISGVVNQKSHNEAVRNTPRQRFSKVPPLFGIHLLVDDLPGVKIECEQQNCKALIIPPSEKNWVEIVKQEIDVIR
ncbi:hypothetical protein KCM76_24865 [Zooshikella marina]|uniref:hypothetical protein n=1 Tax=Zooshikella ganghwensis TaxID=202772 RepID=UPI001BB01738|nr:hypothetical protein [Zooshikella ganghwensis]MBU2709251.1 hypothetical protein [Zooshikella ganghwensis]